ncbi:aspartyl/asparaginyl beta-hydroxylase domain-containing protein [Sphingomonas ginsenosidimutans]|uniref:aspartyl/asparaginyl beta-hydroxylase domain-containing protein n=2 Tax=Sphingomonas TaxID=13687 RepID=UPI0023548B28|nr:aspartyl/asparaginyl beta-hydroxylase domain-containing protein [Sphingomonas ginsenosidimutans]
MIDGAAARLRDQSDDDAVAVPPVAPRPRAVVPAPVAAPIPPSPPLAAPLCPRPTGLAERMSRLMDRPIAGWSLVPGDPVLDMRGFGWTAALRADWRAIRAEAQGDAGPVLWRHGAPVDAALAHRPATRALIAAIAGVEEAAFVALAPGAHVPPRRGPTRALLTCHLGLAVPRDGDVRMRVHDRIVRWAEGETLVFDDTCEHEMWNDSGAARIVLAIRFARPLRQPGRWVADRMLRWMRRAGA